jgi:putative lipoprotein
MPQTLRSIVLAVVVMLLGLGPLAARAEDADQWLGPDKALHFGVATGIAAGSYAGASLFLDARWQRATAAAGFTLSLGAAKELYDATGHGDPSLRDFTWDILGCAVGVGISLLIDLMLSPAPKPQQHDQNARLSRR